jgi:hypothetical protein
MRTASVRRHRSSKYYLIYSLAFRNRYWKSASKGIDRHCLHFRFCEVLLLWSSSESGDFKWQILRLASEMREESKYHHIGRYASQDSCRFSFCSSVKTVRTVFIQTFLMLKLPVSMYRTLRFIPLKFTESLFDLIILSEIIISLSAFSLAERAFWIFESIISILFKLLKPSNSSCFRYNRITTGNFQRVAWFQCRSRGEGWYFILKSGDHFFLD